VLVVDDGSEDDTSSVASLAGAEVIRHTRRTGKAIALLDAIKYARRMGYEAVIEIGADAIPLKGSLKRMAKLLTLPGVGGVSARQIPVGQGLAYEIDELMWAVLRHGKRIQMRRQKNSHLGSVMYGFKLMDFELTAATINEDEYVGITLLERGLKTLFDEDSIAFFDASSSLTHCYVEAQEDARRSHAVKT